MKLPRVILASRSPRRADLLKSLGVEFEVVGADLAEVEHEEMTAMELAQINAYRKARSVAKQYPHTIVLGSDTLVTVDRTVLGKPKDRADARRMLELLQGRTHQVVTGVCLMQLRSHRCRIFADLTDVTFRKLTAAQIDRYHGFIDPMDKAGGYAIQEGGELLVARIEGSFSNVVGLPLEKLEVELEIWP